MYLEFVHRKCFPSCAAWDNLKPKPFLQITVAWDLLSLHSWSPSSLSLPSQDVAAVVGGVRVDVSLSAPLRHQSFRWMHRWFMVGVWSRVVRHSLLSIVGCCSLPVGGAAWWFANCCYLLMVVTVLVLWLGWLQVRSGSTLDSFTFGLWF